MRLMPTLLMTILLAFSTTACDDGSGDSDDDIHSFDLDDDDSDDDDSSDDSSDDDSLDDDSTDDDSSGDDELYKEFESADVKVEYRVEGSYLKLKLRAPTTGWVAVGIEPSAMMKDANILIGYVSSSGAVFVRDDFGDTATTHVSDDSLGGSDDVSDVDGEEKDGETRLSFKIPLDSGDQYDHVLVPGNTYKAIVARGGNGVDDFTTQHVAVGAGQLVL